MKAGRLVFCIAFLACYCLFAVAAKNDFPDWATAATHNTIPSTVGWQPESATLFHEKLLTVSPDGKTIRRERSVTKILRPVARDFFCMTSYDVDQKLSYMHGWVLAADGKQYAAKDSDFVEVGLDDDRSLHTSTHFRALRAPAADTGAIVACEFEIKERPYINEEIWRFQSSSPLSEGALELDLPPSWQYYAVWKSYSSVQPVEVQPGHWRWSLHNIPAVKVDDVPMHPSQAALEGRVSVHYGSTVATTVDDRWRQIGVWVDNLAAHRTDPSPEITARAHSLADNEKDFFGKLQRITEDIQNHIRYFVVEIGIGGNQPHFASDIFRNQYGDCKDKATLLVSMLSAVGIQGRLVVVDTNRGVIDPKVPSIAGNHMITAIELPSGYNDPRLQSVVTLPGGKQYLIFDPTDQWTPVGKIRSDLQGGYGLIVAAEDSHIVQFPVAKPESNTINRTGSFELSADGVLKGEIKEVRRGDAATTVRYYYDSHDEKKVQQWWETRLLKDLTGLKLVGPEAAHLKEISQPLEMKYEITAASYARQTGPLFLIRPRVIGTDAWWFDNKPRVYPVDLEETGQWKDSFDIHLPAGYAVDELPAAVSIETDFATYHSSVTAKDNVLHFEREFVVKQLELPADKYSKLTEVLGQISADEQATAVLTKQ